MPGFYDGYQVILHVKHHDSDLESFVFTIEDNAQHPVSGPLKDKNSAYTFGSVIMVLSETPELHVAQGRRMSCLIKSYGLHVRPAPPPSSGPSSSTLLRLLAYE